MHNHCESQIREKKRTEISIRALAIRAYWQLRTAANVPLMILFCVTDQQEVIMQDVARWMERYQAKAGGRLRSLLYLLTKFTEFRSLFYYRLHHGNLIGAALGVLFRGIYKPCSTLFLNSPTIGPGFFIQHGYATSVSATFGRNCSINQSVAVGHGAGDGPPRVGNNVSVKVGARVLGAITIGDNVVIGANAVVVKDVPADCVVAGVPARIIRRNGVRVDEAL